MTRNRITALIVDDEPIARSGLRTLLERESDIDIVGEARNGREALELIRGNRPDLVFLDVQMPDVDGFGVLTELDTTELPAVVFVTAYDEYALRAFEVNATDYLLKPFDRDRLHESLRRVRRYLASDTRPEFEDRIAKLLGYVGSSEPGSANPYLADRLLVKDRDRVTFVKRREISWIEVRGNYLRLHVGPNSYLLRTTLTDIERQLDPHGFVRISRSLMVNIAQVEELRRLGNGRYRITMSDGSALESSRRYRRRVERYLGIS
jgi:two-component system LytT family response regulator